MKAFKKNLIKLLKSFKINKMNSIINSKIYKITNNNYIQNTRNQNIYLINIKLNRASPKKKNILLKKY